MKRRFIAQQIKDFVCDDTLTSSLHVRIQIGVSTPRAGVRAQIFPGDVVVLPVWGNCAGRMLKESPGHLQHGDEQARGVKHS